jgi:hypothetical protein
VAFECCMSVCMDMHVCSACMFSWIIVVLNI